MSLSISAHVRAILDELGIDVKHPDFEGTPERVEETFLYFFANNVPEIIELFNHKFPSANDEMITFCDIPAYGMCPHHLLPVTYVVSFGYIPNGEVLGLSKIVRLVKLVCRYPDLQENITDKIMRYFLSHISTKGVMVVVKGVHGCMSCRGVEESVPVVTTAVDGEFIKATVRNEFLEAIKYGRKTE